MQDPKKIGKNSPSAHHRTTLSGCVFATKACIDNRKKNLSKSSISCTCPHNISNVGPLAAEIGLPVWGTPAHFNGFPVLASLLHGTLVVGVSQTLRRGVEQRAPPIFGRAAITLGIGPHFIVFLSFFPFHWFFDVPRPIFAKLFHTTRYVLK